LAVSRSSRSWEERCLEAILLFSLFARVDVQIGWSSLDPVRLPGVPLTLALLALILLLPLSALRSKRDYRQQRLSVPVPVSMSIVAMTALAVASVVWAPHTQPVLRGLVYLTQGLLAFLYFAINKADDRDVIFRANVICFWITMSCGVAIAQYFVPSSFGLAFMDVGEPWDESVGATEVRRVSGFGATPNELARNLAIWLPTAMIFATTSLRPIRARLIGIAAFMVGAVALVMTYSRGGLLTLACTMFIGMFVLATRKALRRAFDRDVVAIAALLLAALLFAALVIPSVLDRFVLPDDGQASSRLSMAEVAMNLIAAEYTTGVGLNNYVLEMDKYDSTRARISETFPYPVHNFYLLLTGELGLAAIGAFVALSFATLKHGFTSHNRSPIQALFELSVILALISFLINGMVEGDSLGSHMMIHFWIAGGCLLGISVRGTKTAQ
jgi:O-antigen ligase